MTRLALATAATITLAALWIRACGRAAAWGGEGKS